MTEKQIRSVWIRGYGGYYVSDEKKEARVSQIFVKNIDVYVSPCGIKIECPLWDGGAEVIYTTHASVKYADNTSEGESN